MLHQPFRRVFVLTTGKLAATGNDTLSLATGQLGIYQTSTYKSISNPSYPTQREIFFAMGKAVNADPALMGGFPNEASYKSEIVQGPKIIAWRGKKAQKGDYKSILSIGWDGSDAAKTIKVGEEETKYVSILVQGPAITKFVSPDGITAEFFLEGPCAADPLAPTTAPCYSTAKKLAEQINTYKFSGVPLSKFIRATAKFSCNPSLSDPSGTVDCESWQVTIPDGGANAGVNGQAVVQGQYPGSKVVIFSTDGVYTTYSITQLASAADPGPVTNAGATFLPDCTTCPANYTYVNAGYVYKVVRTDAGDAGALTTTKSNYGITGTEITTRVSYAGGISTYIVVSTTSIGSASGSDVLTFLSQQSSGMCILTTPTTYAWVAGPASKKYPKTYNITLADDACSTDFLPLLQAAYPNDTVALVTDGDCTKSYSLVTLSECNEPGCYQQPSVWTNPQSFRAYNWVEAPAAADPADCVCGVFIESVWVPEQPNDLLMDYDNLEYDAVHIQASTYSKDYNDPSGRCATDIPVTRLKSPSYPMGLSTRVRALEEKSRQYDLEYRDEDIAVRNAEGFVFNTQHGQYYDKYELEFEVERLTGGWAQKTQERCCLDIFVATGQGKEIETAINTYVDSVGIKLPPVVL